MRIATRPIRLACLLHVIMMHAGCCCCRLTWLDQASCTPRASHTLGWPLPPPPSAQTTTAPCRAAVGRAGRRAACRKHVALLQGRMGCSTATVRGCGDVRVAPSTGAQHEARRELIVTCK